MDTFRGVLFDVFFVISEWEFDFHHRSHWNGRKKFQHMYAIISEIPYLYKKGNAHGSYSGKL